MKQKTFIRITSAFLFLVISSFALISFTTQKMIGEFWKQLGMTEQQGKDDINNSFLTGYFSYYGARNIKNIATGDRAAITTDMLSYVKQHVNSPVFEKGYQQYRDKEKSKIYPVAPAITREELTKKKITEAETTLKTFEDLLKITTDPAIVKSHKEQIEFWKKAIADYRSPNSEQIKYELLMDENRYKSDKENYDQQMKKWEPQYPQSADQFIKLRLNEFLDATKDIDYKAALVEKSDKKIFVNPVYERKNSKWKMGFRAGKEVTETTRTFVQQWVKELN